MKIFQQPLSTTAQRGFRTRAGSGDVGRREGIAKTGPGPVDDKQIQLAATLQERIDTSAHPESKLQFTRALFKVQAQIDRTKGKPSQPEPVRVTDFVNNMRSGSIGSFAQVQAARQMRFDRITKG